MGTDRSKRTPRRVRRGSQWRRRARHADNPDVAPPFGDVVRYTDFEFDLLYNTRPANVTRMPAITLPSGTTDGLPVGFQLMGSEFDDARLCGLAATVESRLT